MKILVIFTGGTIGSSVSDGAISPNRDTKFFLINDFYDRYGKICEFLCREPYFALSENLNADTLNKLVSEVKSAMSEDFDGIIVTHGTDTLQFSAAAVAFAARDTKFPIVFVSSNYPLTDKRANGRDNFKAAVDHILSDGETGVYIAYKNSDSAACIIPANRAYTFLEDDDRVFGSKGSVSCGVSDFTFCQSPEILVISSHPADGYSYSLKGVGAVLIRPYHSGTLPTESERLRAFCQRAKEDAVPLFLCGGAEGVTYESSEKFTELGITALPHSPFAATYIKLWIGISRKEDLKNFMKNEG